MTDDQKPPKKRGSNYSGFNNAKELHENHQYGRYGPGVTPTILTIRRARTISLRPYETERMEIMVTLELETTDDPNLIAAALEADLHAQLNKWEQKIRGYADRTE